MRRFALPIAVAALSLATVMPGVAANVPDYIAAAVADKDRPKDDTDRDALRKPAEIAALTEVKPGARVVDVGPGRTGYYTRIFSRVVGAGGKVYMFNPTWVAEKFPQVKDAPANFLKTGYANVEGVIQPMAEIKFDAPVDLVFISQLYHDQVWQKIDVAKMNKAIFDALKPGGVYFVIDHTGASKTPEEIDKTHRIDPALVKEQILAAGFVLEAESDLLRNPDDPKTANVFDASIRGKTDQFVYKFGKPAK